MSINMCHPCCVDTETHIHTLGTTARHHITSPGQHITSPGQHITSPGQHIISPGQHITPPGQHITPSGTTSHRQVSTSHRQVSTSHRQVSTSHRQVPHHIARSAHHGVQLTKSGRQATPGSAPLPVGCSDIGTVWRLLCHVLHQQQAASRGSALQASSCSMTPNEVFLRLDTPCDHLHLHVLSCCWSLQSES
jgi:hypothetical protein